MLECIILPSPFSQLLIMMLPFLFFLRSKRYKAVLGDLPDPDVLKVAEAYKDFTGHIDPLITTMAITEDVPLVQSAFGPAFGR